MPERLAVEEDSEMETLLLGGAKSLPFAKSVRASLTNVCFADSKPQPGQPSTSNKVAVRWHSKRRFELGRVYSQIREHLSATYFKDIEFIVFVQYGAPIKDHPAGPASYWRTMVGFELSESERHILVVASLLRKTGSHFFARCSWRGDGRVQRGESCRVRQYVPSCDYAFVSIGGMKRYRKAQRRMS